VIACKLIDWRDVYGQVMQWIIVVKDDFTGLCYLMMRATCPSIDGNKDAGKFNSEYKNNIPNVEMSDVKKIRNQNHSITITMWTVSYIFLSSLSMLNLNCRCIM
jgi:hypothetical protein